VVLDQIETEYKNQIIWMNKPSAKMLTFSIAELSDQDKSSIIDIARRLKEIIPAANVIFAVHAVSRESPRQRTLPMKAANNRVKWSSITRTHEVAFFSENSEPFEVSI